MNYLVGVSGGVDSVALLDMLVHNEIDHIEPGRIIVAHFDHGIRPESSSDAAFVAALADKHGLEFELGKANLGKGASEEEARDKRYDFLRRCCKSHNAQLVLAHHRDDVLETMIINLTRGTSWRGLVSLRSTPEILRPLLSKTKTELLAYAEHHHLQWVEDSTNVDQTYLRNYVRHTVVPRAQAVDGSFSHTMLKFQSAVAKLQPKITEAVAQVTASTAVSDNTYVCSRYNLIMWPSDVAREYIYAVLTDLAPDWHPEERHIVRALHFAKTAKPGRTLSITKGLKLSANMRHIEFQKH